MRIKVLTYFNIFSKFILSGSLFYDEYFISDDIDDFGKAPMRSYHKHIQENKQYQILGLKAKTIHVKNSLLEPWIWMFVAWKYCREEDKRRINLVRKIFFAHFEANEKILYKAAKISAQEALKKQLENKWNNNITFNAMAARIIPYVTYDMCYNEVSNYKAIIAPISMITALFDNLI